MKQQSAHHTMVWGLKFDLIFSENVHKPLLYRKLLKVKFTLHLFHPLVLTLFPDTGERQIYHTASCTTCCFTQAADLFHWDPYFNYTSFFFLLFFKTQKSNSIVISLYTHSMVVFWILYLCSGCHISRVVTLRGKNSLFHPDKSAHHWLLCVPLSFPFYPFKALHSNSVSFSAVSSHLTISLNINRLK